MRQLIWKLAAAFAAAGTVAGSMAAAAGSGSLATAASPQRGGCILTGTAIIRRGLTTRAHAISYTFTGVLKNCESTVKGVTSGKISASGRGTGSCASSSSKGTAVIRWNDGKVSDLSFTTSGAAAALTVAATVRRGLFAGEPSRAALLFQANPAQCTAKGGVARPSFSGPAELGA
jgi:hypothetical protein